MKTNAYLGLVLTLGLAGACGDAATDSSDSPSTVGGGSGIPVGSTVDVNGDGVADGTAIDANNDGIPESIDRNGDGVADGLLPTGTTVVGAIGGGGGSAGTNAANGGGGGGGTNGDVGIVGVDDDGGAPGGGTSGPVVVMTKATVLCGDSEAEIDVGNKYACCDSLTGDTWAAPAVKAGCNMYSGTFTSTTDSVGSECDGRDDCGTAFCCFVYNTMGPPPSANRGRAHGRKCMTEATCNDTQAFSGASATFSCTDDSDCPQSSQKCVAEPSGGLTSAGKAGRPWVKICK